MASASSNLGTWRLACKRFLFSNRMTPHSTTGETPFQLLWHQRKPRSRLDLVFPDIQGRVLNRQAAMDRHCTVSSRELCCGDAVWVLNFAATPKWLSAVLEERLGPLTFSVRLSDGRVWKRHVDHIRSRVPDEGNPADLPEPSAMVSSKPTATSSPTSDTSPASASASLPVVQQAVEASRHSNRSVRPPRRLDW